MKNNQNNRDFNSFGEFLFVIIAVPVIMFLTIIFLNWINKF